MISVSRNISGSCSYQKNFKRCNVPRNPFPVIGNTSVKVDPLEERRRLGLGTPV